METEQGGNARDAAARGVVTDSPLLSIGDTCTGSRFLSLITASADWLETNCAAVNALNVFPVPDGDTGTNMLLTLRTALR
ncbi:MAG: DAK2 domain-containing protein, partial [Chloroflexi bacterium]|nr:DAK2 domain-containing protein [Chloroflexota bacterium]